MHCISDPHAGQHSFVGSRVPPSSLVADEAAWHHAHAADSEPTETRHSQRQAVIHGISSKGPLEMSSSHAVHEALSLDYLTGQGVVSLFTIWQKLTARK